MGEVNYTEVNVREIMEVNIIPFASKTSCRSKGAPWCNSELCSNVGHNERLGPWHKISCVSQLFFQSVFCSPWDILRPSHHLWKQGQGDWMQASWRQLCFGCSDPSPHFVLLPVIRSAKGTFQFPEYDCDLETPETSCRNIWPCIVGGINFCFKHVFSDSKDDRCLHAALLYDIRYKCQLNLPTREQPLLPSLDVFGMGWVLKRPFQSLATEMLPKTHDPIYSSWTPSSLLLTRSLSLSS